MDQKYQRIRVLGKGSFGKAYLVRNTEADALCVVKQMETSMMDRKERDEAVKEALLLKRMDHPNIVRFQEVFMTRKGRLCIVMDYADGGDVHMELKRQNGILLPEAKIIEWFVQSVFALKHVHGRKVLHRDLKTQNIFLMASGQIKLGDFGIARVLDATKEFAKTMVGTPYYLSPEIIEDRPYNFKSDIWSCGVVLYEMTTLKHPFDAESLVILAGKILKDQYPDPDAMYSPELKAMIRSMLSKDANMRPMIDAILSKPFLNASMNESNVKYNLGLDLSPFNAAVMAPPCEAFVAPEPDAPVDALDGREGRPSLAERRRQEVGAAQALGQTPDAALPLSAAEDGDTVLMGTVAATPVAALSPTAPSAGGAAGGESDYDLEEFEDYSGSEDGDRKEPQSALQRSVANLRLGGGEATAASAPQGAGAREAPAPGACGPADLSATASSSRIAAKAALLRAYLCSQVPEADFDTAYALVRSSSRLALPAEEMQRRVGEVIGADKAPELFTLFQLLCFLEDVASNRPET